MDKKLIDDCFYIEEKKWGTWDSYTPEGKCIITALTEQDCVSATRYMLKLKQENLLDKSLEKTYTGTIEGKL